MIVGTILTAVLVKYTFPYNWTWVESLLFGAMFSATDPVAVVAVLKEVCLEHNEHNEQCNSFESGTGVSADPGRLRRGLSLLLATVMGLMLPMACLMAAC